MKESKDVRELKNLIFNYCLKYSHLFTSIEKLETDLTFLLNKGNKYYTYINYNEQDISNIQLILNLYKKAKKIGLNEDWVNNLQSEYHNIRFKRKLELEKKPLGERRDNRKEKVLNNSDSRYQHTNARYPSKKRSKRHWKNFYNHFPNLAKRDNWDGNKSDKM